MKKNIWLPLVVILVLWLVGVGGTYAATVFSKSMNASVNIVANPDFVFYADMSATQLINEVSLPDVTPGGTSTFTFYVKNTSTVTEVLSAGTNSVPSSRGTLTITFDGQAQKTLAVNAVARVNGTLTVPGQAPAGPIEFTFSINAVPVTTATTTPPTATTTASPTTTTTAAINGQTVFNANCLSCHRSLPSTGRTQAQLFTFISGHQTGRNLTSQQVTAVVNLIKP